MPSWEVVSQENKKVGTVNLDEKVFGAKVNHALVHQVIKAQLANRRRGTASTKTRAEVRGGGKKPFKQKGTGNARRGSSRSPLVVGGGVTFGPKPRDFSQKVPKKMVQGAVCSALSDRAKEKRLIVVDEWKLEPKTKVLAGLLKKNFKVEKALIVDSKNENLERSGKNIKHVKVLRADGLNVYDVVKHEWLIVSKSAVGAIQERMGRSS